MDKNERKQLEDALNKARSAYEAAFQDVIAAASAHFEQLQEFDALALEIDSDYDDSDYGTGLEDIAIIEREESTKSRYSGAYAKLNSAATAFSVAVDATCEATRDIFKITLDENNANLTEANDSLASALATTGDRINALLTSNPDVRALHGDASVGAIVSAQDRLLSIISDHNAASVALNAASVAYDSAFSLFSLRGTVTSFGDSDEYESVVCVELVAAFDQYVQAHEVYVAVLDACLATTKVWIDSLPDVTEKLSRVAIDIRLMSLSACSSIDGAARLVKSLAGENFIAVRDAYRNAQTRTVA